MGPRVAVVDHPRSFPPFDLLPALAGQFEVVWVLGRGTPSDGIFSRLRSRFGIVVDVSEMGMDDAAECLADLHVDGITTFVDENYVVTAELAALLGLPGHTPEVARRLATKCEQREAFARRGLTGPAFWRAPAGTGEAGRRTLAGRVTYPAVVKPFFGSGSKGIRAVADPAGLMAVLAAEDAIEQVVEAYLPDAVDGRWFASYLSVETHVRRSRPHHVALTGRFPLAPPFRETGNFVPAEVSPDLRTQLFELAGAAIETSGITDSPVHTEIKLTPDGPQLIEVNGRLGGRPIFVLASLSDANLFEDAFRIAVGLPPAQREVAPRAGVGYWLMLQPTEDAEAVIEVTGLDRCAHLPGVTSVELHVHPGQAIDRGLGTYSRVVTARGTVPDHGALPGAIASIRSSVRVRYRPETPPRATHGGRPEPRMYGEGLRLVDDPGPVTGQFLSYTRGTCRSLPRRWHRRKEQVHGRRDSRGPRPARQARRAGDDGRRE